MSVQDLNKRKKEILDAQERMLQNAVTSKVAFSAADEASYTNLTNELNSVDSNIARFTALQAGRDAVAVPGGPIVSPALSNASGSQFVALGNRGNRYATTVLPTVNANYRAKFWTSMRTAADFDRFLISNAVLGENGSASLGGALVPVQTSPNIPALAVPESSVRKLVNILTSEMNIELPYQSALTQATLTQESNSTGTNLFAQNPPSFGTTTLGAFQIGGLVIASWSLLSDVRAAESFITRDLGRAIVTAEEQLLVGTGTGNSLSGTGQPQGLLGNGLTAVGESITAGAAPLSINPILDMESTLNSSWYTDAKFLMHRATFNNLVKNQLALNQYMNYISYTPGGGGTLLGYPVAYSAQMPVFSASPATTGAILFSNFEAYATLADRGSNDVLIKVLDQPFATSGQTAVLGFRRSDMRIVLSQACVQLNING
jgi:HK97 family phage major capsid protein